MIKSFSRANFIATRLLDIRCIKSTEGVEHHLLSTTRYRMRHNLPLSKYKQRVNNVNMTSRIRSNTVGELAAGTDAS